MKCNVCEKEITWAYCDGSLTVTINGIKHDLTVYEEDKICVSDKDSRTFIRKVIPIVEKELHINKRPNIEVNEIEYICPTCGCAV